MVDNWVEIARVLNPDREFTFQIPKWDRPKIDRVGQMLLVTTYDALLPLGSRRWFQRASPRLTQAIWLPNSNPVELRADGVVVTFRGPKLVALPIAETSRLMVTEMEPSFAILATEELKLGVAELFDILTDNLERVVEDFQLDAEYNPFRLIFPIDQFSDGMMNAKQIHVFED